jgi:molecular chaperone HtpG
MAKTKKKNDVETIKFDTEVDKIMKLVIHSLYTNKDIFLRELISNSSDACDKLKFLAITKPELIKDDPDFKITISVDEEKRTLTITDNGIGMNRQDLIDNIGTIASSGTQRFLDQMTGNKETDIQLIGQFGVGFYAVFMVADNVTVTSRKAGEKEGWKWQSKGDSNFTIEREEKAQRGTSITLHLKEGEDGYLDRFRIQHIVTTYSDHIPIPVEFQSKDNKEILNRSSAIWMRPKSKITEEQNNEFYKHVSHQPDKPWLTLHNRNEGTIEFTNLLYVPSKQPFDLFHPDRMCRVKLYVKRVFITDENVKLIPAYLRFLRGIVDSEDLPLNISRETLQHNHMIEKINKTLTKKAINELKKKLENDRDSYEEFWNNFGAVLKEGLCEALPEDEKEKLLEICLFRSALHGKLVTLDEYIAACKENQKDIFIFSGEDPEKAKNSPQLEGFLKEGIDVLILSDTVDNFWLNVQPEFRKKEIKSVTRSDIKMDELTGKKKDDESTKKDEKKSDELIDFFKATLDSVVKDVKASTKLVDSPVCLSVSEGAMDIKMERYLIEQKQLAMPSAKILEINTNHPILKKIAKDIKNDDKSEVGDLVRLLFDQACVQEGEPVPDVGEFAKRMNYFLSKKN